MTEYEISAVAAEKEARLRVLDDEWTSSRAKLELLWCKGLGPRPDVWAIEPHRGGNPPPTPAELDKTRKQKMAYEKWREELQSEQDAQIQENLYKQEQEMDERLARQHARYIDYFGTTAIQRESAQAAVALYDERDRNKRQLGEHVYFSRCPLMEAQIRQAGTEIDQRIEDQRSQREFNYSEAQALRDYHNQRNQAGQPAAQMPR